MKLTAKLRSLFISKRALQKDIGVLHELIEGLRRNITGHGVKIRCQNGSAKLHRSRLKDLENYADQHDTVTNEQKEYLERLLKGCIALTLAGQGTAEIQEAMRLDVARQKKDTSNLRAMSTRNAVKATQHDEKFTNHGTTLWKLKKGMAALFKRIDPIERRVAEQEVSIESLTTSLSVVTERLLEAERVVGLNRDTLVETLGHVNELGDGVGNLGVAIKCANNRIDRHNSRFAKLERCCTCEKTEDDPDDGHPAVG